MEEKDFDDIVEEAILTIKLIDEDSSINSEATVHRRKLFSRHLEHRKHPKEQEAHEFPFHSGSILDMLDEMVKVGQVMGYNMEGCKSNMADIIRSQGVEEETKMENMNLLCVRMCWGNLDFEYARSDSVGNSGEFYGQLVLLIAVFAARDQRKATSLGLSFNSDIFSK
ncbi:hypothetical protein Tco_1140910 [Tanacetum coccineum]